MPQGWAKFGLGNAEDAMSNGSRRAAQLAVIGVVGLGLAGSAFAQVNSSASVNAGSPILYANGAATATMPATGLGLCSSVYANMWDDPSLPGDIAASGVQIVRYPGGSYSDIYNWSLNTANEGGYVGPHADMGNFFNVINAAGTQAMITVNYGSNTTDTMGAQPQEAAAEVAYADANPNIYGTSSDVTLSTDAAGVNWYTAGYWARLRASTPAQYQSWATAAGDYNPAYSFLAIGHSAPENIQYWEIGNEIGGNGYLGYQWEYDLHAPYNNGNTNDNTGRKNNPLLSPTAYAQNLNQFAMLMKQVDPNIKIGAGFDAEANSTGDKAILQTAGNNIDFGIIHWYPTGSLPTMITSTLPEEIANLRTSVQNNTTKGYNGIEIDVTEFGDGNSSPPTVENALFAADAYATGFENGLKNMNFQEMSTSHYLNGNGTAGSPGEVYYAIQMVSKYAATGDTFVSTSSSNSSLRIHAAKKPDGSISLLIINDSTTAADNLSVSLNGVSPLTTSGTLYQFGNSNISGSGTTAPTSQALTNLGSSFSLSIPLETIDTLVIPALWLSWDNAGGSGNGVTWDSSSQNWNNGSAPATFLSGVNVNFGDSNNGHYAVTLNSNLTTNLIAFNNSLGDYTISGTGGIGGSGSLTKTGSRTATLSTVNTYTGGTVVNGGILVVGVNGALPDAALSIGAAGTLQLGAGTGLAKLTSLSIASGGVLDVNNNHLILSYTGSSPMGTIVSYLSSGYADGAWNGPGIDSSAAHANSGYGVAIAQGGDGVVAGLSLGQIEVSYALYGDINLDGAVNGTDFAILAGNFGQSVTKGWEQGDLTYDGSVNGTDFALLAQNFGKTATGTALALPASDWAALDAFAVSHGLTADLPEPRAGIIGTAIGLSGLGKRRRRATA
jgi:autotransporter-associated beta strand protein